MEAEKILLLTDGVLDCVPLSVVFPDYLTYRIPGECYSFLRPEVCALSDCAVYVCKDRPIMTGSLVFKRF